MKKVFFYSIILIFECCINISICQAVSSNNIDRVPEEGLSANPWKKSNKIKKRNKLIYTEHVQKYNANARDMQIEQIQKQTQAIIQRNNEAQKTETRRQLELEKQKQKNEQKNKDSSSGFDMFDLIAPKTNTTESNSSQTQKQNKANDKDKSSIFDSLIDEYNKTAKKVSKMKRKTSNYYNKTKNYTKKSIKNLNKMFK